MEIIKVWKIGLNHCFIFAEWLEIKMDSEFDWT